MAAKNKTELAELKELISDRFNKLEQGQESIKATTLEIDKRLVAVETKLDGLDTRLKNVETSVQKIPELAK